jgi:3-hydroxyisobutyrate dehydrogenase-like beta-hydroxyacid dehydrogenase
MKIGFIGLGIMRSRMAANLQKNGYPLVVFNRTRAKAEPLLGPCGTFSDSTAKLAEQVDVVFTMLAHPDAVEQAALGPDGFLDHLRANARAKAFYEKLGFRLDIDYAPKSLAGSATQCRTEKSATSQRWSC